ncbi:MAG TPA: protein kinase [Pyrinomonadaceae bacterium]|jgi:serine/threonine protein kinase/Flp pilus assembly protein TadD|nr:protein kinase [Pyrinomonadaceae bacterium]
MDLENIGRYRILEKLGSGGMGEVYLAEDTHLGRKVALKLLAQELTQNRDRLSRFDQEAYAASALNHPNIITIYEMGDEAGRHFIATEYVDGETLRKRFNGPPMDLSEVLGVGIQIAEALEEAHAASIIHRDIKPENVMIRRSGHVKVLDFGLAKLMEKPAADDTDTEAVTRALVQTDAGMVLGTSQYMSPEQARGKPVDARTDIWSLGVVLYEMATGRAPFHGETKTDVIVAIAKNDPAPVARFVPNAPPEFEWIVLKALRKDVDERYQTIKELLSDLRKLKQRIEFHSELERSMGPESVSAFGRLADTEIHGTTPPSLSTQTTAAPALSTSGLASATQTRASSVEYVVTEIKRHKIAFAVTAGVVVIAAAAIVYFSVRHRKTVLTEKDTILLADFTNTTGDPLFDDTLKQALAVQLAQSPFLNIFSEERVREQLRFMNVPQDARITRDIGKTICARQSIKAMLLGSISAVGSRYVVLLEAVNSQTGDMIASEQFEVQGKEQVLKELGPAASRLREKLGESLGSIKAFDAPIENVTTSSLDALRQYSLGMQLHSRADYGRAIPFYQAAIKIDPNFAIAHARLASCFNTLRQLEASRAEFTKANELRDRVSEREKFFITSHYYGGVTGQWELQIEELEKWKLTYPHDWEPLNLLCSRYTITGPFELAVNEGNKAIELNPNDARAYVNLGVAFIELNRFDEAKNVLLKAQQLGLESANMHARLYQLGFLQHDAELMKQQIDWANENPRNAENALNWQAQVAAFQGQPLQADQWTDRAIAMNRNGDSKETIAQMLLAEAVRNATFENCTRASAEVKAALALSREQANLIGAANAYARCGLAAPAQMLADELTKSFQLDTLLNSTWLPIIRAQTELSKGNAAQAVQLLGSTRRYEPFGDFWPQYLRGEAYLKLKDGTQAAAEFKTILDHRGWYPTSPLYVLAQLGAARAQALNGDNAAARTAYQDFFTLWQGADANLSMLVAARQEYDKLK